MKFFGEKMGQVSRLSIRVLRCGMMVNLVVLWLYFVISVNGLNLKMRFEMHLLNLVTKAYGTEFAATGLKVTFPVVDDIEICMVEIKASNKPLYTEVMDKNGVKSNKFFVRRGNSSHELPLLEVADHIASRFGP